MTHSACTLPALDDQTIDLSLAILALMSQGEFDFARDTISESTKRLFSAARNNQLLPVDTDSIEDSFSLEEKPEINKRAYFKTSTLVPMLSSAAAFLDFQLGLDRIRENLAPLLTGVTLERWFASAEMETMAATEKPVVDVGTSRSIEVQSTILKEIEESLKPLRGVASASEFKWHGTQFEVFAVMSARLHRHPVPTWFFDKYRTNFKAPISDDSQKDQ